MSVHRSGCFIVAYSCVFMHIIEILKQYETQLTRQLVSTYLDKFC